MRIQIQLMLPREAASVPLARHTVVAALTSAGIDPDCVDEAELALSEACTNALHHAAGTQEFEVMITITDAQLMMDVLDTGAGFGPMPPLPAMPPVTADGGRGVALITALTDRAVFDSVSGSGAAVHLMKQLRWAQQAPLVRRRNYADGRPEPLG